MPHTKYFQHYYLLCYRIMYIKAFRQTNIVLWYCICTVDSLLAFVIFNRSFSFVKQCKHCKFQCHDIHYEDKQ
jgi:hypothetical protein